MDALGRSADALERSGDVLGRRKEEEDEGDDDAGGDDGSLLCDVLSSMYVCIDVCIYAHMCL